LLEPGPRWGTLVPVMSRSPDRCSTLERGSPRRNHGHAVPNPRMRACSTGVFGSCLLLCAPTIGAVRGGGVKNCAPPLESEQVAASWINAIGAVQLAQISTSPKLGGWLPGLRLSFFRFERFPHITQPASVPTGQPKLPVGTFHRNPSVWDAGQRK
jgi:hypothetical protein